MKSTSKYDNTSYGYIGLEDTPKSLQATEDDKPMLGYALFDIKRLTKSNSFIILDESFYIAKKDINGKPCNTYQVYRVEDKRHICSSALDKEETINYVKRMYFELDNV